MMWKAIEQMSAAELAEATEQTQARLQSVAGHNRARRLEEQLKRLWVEADSREDSNGVSRDLDGTVV